MCITINVNNSNSYQALKKIELADGREDKAITALGLEKALETEPELLNALMPEEKNEVEKLLQSGNSVASIKLEFDAPTGSANIINPKKVFPPVDKNHPPVVSDIVSRTEELMKILKTDDKVVPESAKKALEKLSANERLMLGFALEELNKMSESPQATESQYMIKMLKYAADVSGGDKTKFVALASTVFAAPAGGYGMEGARALAGGGAHISGEICEPLLVQIVKPRGGSTEAQGYNPNIIDSEDKSSTVTHHYGEFLKTGFSRGQTLGDAATLIMDKPWNNPGDVRNGYFAVMLGSALFDERINPKDVVKLTEWSHTRQEAGKLQPLWGEKAQKDLGDYNIENWVKAYNQAFSGNKINLGPEPVNIDPNYPIY